MKKQGISLIVLVITIIVLAILAAAVIISINNTGLINSSQTAALENAYANVTDLLTMKYSDLRVAASLGTSEDHKDGVISDKIALEAYDQIFDDQGFTAKTALSETQKVGIYTKSNGTNTLYVKITYTTDGVQTVEKSYSELTV